MPRAEIYKSTMGSEGYGVREAYMPGRKGCSAYAVTLNPGTGMDLEIAWVYGGLVPEAKATADLFAAAPDLRDAGRRVYELYNDSRQVSGPKRDQWAREMQAAIAALHAALGKAEGR